jgi:adenylate cyclase class 2
MPLEVEQKFAVSDRALLIRALESLGTTFDAAVQQIDRYYAHPCRDYVQTDEALRIRRVGNDNFVTYKGPKLDPTTKTRRELELPIAAGDEGDAQFASLLEALGFRPVTEVCKTRTTGHLDWEKWPVEIALDQVDEVGNFVELEIQADENRLEDAKRCLASLAERLGLINSLRVSYLELLLEARK